MVAVTGATGLLGSHIIEKLLADGIATIALHRAGGDGLPEGVIKRRADILDEVSLREAFEGATTVIHSAAYVSFNPRWRKKIFDTNVIGTRNAINTCLQSGIKNFIHISSVAALGRTSKKTITEESTWTKAYSTDYAESKYLAELEVYRGAEEGLTVSIVNPSTILSAAQPERSSATLFNYVWNEERYYTDGFLNYVDARDVADVVIQLCKNPQPGEKFILSAGHLTYLNFFSELAKRLKKRAPSINVSPALTFWAGWGEELWARILGREPLVTRQSARMAIQSFQYSNQKSLDSLGIRFRTAEETLDWCCEDYLRNVKPNN
ncbi:SDR family oxidoreductase [soil metagenome]